MNIFSGIIYLRILISCSFVLEKYNLTDDTSLNIF